MTKHAWGFVFSFFLLSTFSSFSLVAHADDHAESEEVSDTEIVSSLTEAFTKHFDYSGNIRKSYSRGNGFGCKKTRDVFVQWQARLKNIDVEITEAGVAQFAFELDNSKAFLSYTGKNTLCLEKGYFGDIQTDSIEGQFYIQPQTIDTPALIQVKSLKLSELQFVNWTLFEPFLWNIHGNAPDFVNSWAQKSFNSLVGWFLQSSFSDRLNKLVSQKVADALRKRYEQHEQMRFPLTQDSGLRLD